MSNYTISVRKIVEMFNQLNEPEGYLTTDAQIAKAAPLIFSFDFPCWGTVEDKVNFEERFLHHFYFREIGFETVAMWQFYLAEELRLKMPYYINLYNLKINEIDPLNEFAEKRTISRTGNTTDNTTGSSKSKYSDTPQGGLTGLEADRYLTNATIDNTTSNNTGTAKEDITENRTGHTTSAMKLIEEYRNVIFNLEQMVFDDLESLFYGLWQ